MNSKSLHFIVLGLMLSVFLTTAGLASEIIYGHPATKVTADGYSHLQDFIDKNQFSAPKHFTCPANQCIGSFTGGTPVCITPLSFDKGGAELGARTWTVAPPATHTIDVSDTGAVTIPATISPEPPVIPDLGGGDDVELVEPGSAHKDLNKDGTIDAWDLDSDGLLDHWDLSGNSAGTPSANVVNACQYCYTPDGHTLSDASGNKNYSNIKVIFIDNLNPVKMGGTTGLNSHTTSIDITGDSKADLTDINWGTLQYAPTATYTAPNGEQIPGVIIVNQTADYKLADLYEYP